MKRISKGSWTGTMVLGVLAAGSVFAGQRLSTVVFIDDNIRFASGSVAGAHNSTDRVQHIGCTVAVQANCVARNSAGITRTCATDNAVMMANARSINSTSMIIFTWTTNGACASISVNNTSLTPPKVHS